MNTDSSILEGLNAVQCEAVRHDHAQQGPLLLLAGAGSGKTAVLVRRLQWLVEVKKRPPASLLGMTFTALAATEMLHRVQEKLGPAAKAIRLCTFHSLALRILREEWKGIPHWKRLGFLKAPTPQERAGMGFESVLAPLKIRLSRELLFSADLAPKVLQALQPLREQCYQSGEVIFEDLLWLAVQLLEGFPEVCALIRQRWTTILVDEYQDINPLQYRLVRAILGDSPRLFVVGDDDQAIYGFRGADIGNILRFRKDYPQCTILRLEWNYRSTPAVIALANRIFPRKDFALRKILRPGNLRQDALFAANAPVKVWHSKSALEEWERLLGTMEHLRAEYGIAWSAFAFLVRFNRQKAWLTQALQNSAIPHGENGVQVETIHGSKGLQYPIVFYMGLAQNLSPAKAEGNRQQKKRQADEERRLFYVGVTRAESQLYLLFCQKRHWQGRMQEFRPSPFLRCLAPTLRPSPLAQRSAMLWKFWIVGKQMVYMGFSMLQYVWARFVQRQEMGAWVSAKLANWARFSLRILHMELKAQQVGLAAQVDWNRPVFVVANHQSYADIPTVLVTLERKLGFVAKKELGYIPFLGYWMLQIGCLMIERGKSGVGNEVNDAIRKMGHAPNLVIFPEGTRSKTGKMGNFKSGAFRMALDHEGVVLPLAIKGTRQGWEARQQGGVQEVVCTVLEPLDVKKIKAENPALSHKDLMNLARKSLELANP